MADLGTLRVTLIANLRKFTAGMKQGIANVKRFSQTVVSSMRKATRSIAQFVLRAGRSLTKFAKKWVRRAIIALGALAVASVKMAANAEESENLVRESFLGMTDAVIRWSERLQKELGLDAIQLRKQAGFFNLLTVSMGATEEQAFKVSTSLTELAADMASFRNQNFENIFNAMRSGMVGMTRPLQNLGINIKENAVDQLLLKMGVDRTAESLTEQERVLARYIAILQATEKDTGDLAHTYDSFTNVIRVMVTNTKILTRELGETLKNAITPLAIRMRDWLLENRGDVAEWFKEVVDKFMDFTAFFTGGTWSQGLERGLALTLQLFSGFGAVVTSLFKDVFTNIGANIGVWMNQAIALSLERRKLMQQALIGQGFSPTVARLTRGAASLGIATRGQLSALEKARKEIETKLKHFRETTLKVAFPEAEGVGTALDTLKEKWLEIAKAMKTATEEGKKLRAEQDKIFAEGQAERDARNAKLRAESKARLRAALADARVEFAELLEANRQAAEGISASWQHTGETIKAVITSANDSIKNSFADMLVSMAQEMDNFGDFAEEFIVNVMKAIARMQAELVAARILGSTATGGLGGGDVLGNVLNFLAGGLGKVASATKDIAGAAAPGVQGPVLGFSRGGVVKPVYAANGFAARGTDTVPAMLTPGEMVLPKEIVELISNRGRSLNINVNAIDAQGTAQWLNNNKRMIAGMMGETSRGNNPSSRRLRR